MLDEGVDAAEAHGGGDQADAGDDLVRVAVDLEGDHRAADARIVDAGHPRVGGEAARRVRRRSRRRPGPARGGWTGPAAADSRPADAAHRPWRTAPAAAARRTPRRRRPRPPARPRARRGTWWRCAAPAARPCSAGRWSTGVAKVLSTSSGTEPQAWATARRSTSASVGLAGDSTSTRPVSGRSASAIPAGSVQVTSEPSSPAVSRWSLQPYRGRTATTCRSPIEAAYEQDGAQRGHAAGERDRRLGALQPGQRGLEAGDGRVAQPPVDGRAVRLGAGGGEGVDPGGLAAAVVRRVGGGQVDRRGVQSLAGRGRRGRRARPRWRVLSVRCVRRRRASGRCVPAVRCRVHVHGAEG